MKKLLFLVLAIFFIEHIVLGQEWNFIEPKFRIFNSESMFFINENIGYVVGYDGMIAKTTNGGASWTNQMSGTLKNLESVFFTDINNGYIVGSQIALKTTDGGNTWINMQTNGKKVFFTNSNVGFIIGQNEVIKKTTNGGQTWVSNQNVYWGDLKSLIFIDDSIGFFAGGNNKILKTTNGGITYTDLSNNASCQYCDYNSIFFINQNIGFIAGDYGKIIKTINGGQSWFSLNSGTTNNLTSIQFSDVNNGIAVCANNGEIYKTSNGGNTWITITANSSFSFNMINSSIYYSMSDRGNFYKSIDGGLTWNNLTNINTKQIHRINFPNKNIGYLLREKSLYKSIDAGATWLNIQNNNNFYNDMFCKDTNLIFIQGYNGSIIKSNNGGQSWQTQYTGSSYNSIYFIDSLKGYLVGDYGKIIKTVDGGNNWVLQNIGISLNLNSVFFIDSNNGYIVGSQGFIFKTTNGGLTWSNQQYGLNQFSLYNLLFTSYNNGFIIARNGTYSILLKTTNGGLTWDESIVSNGDLNSIHFSDINNGIVVGSEGTIYKTENGGLNWTLQPKITEYYITDVSVVDSITAYCTADLVILKYGHQKITASNNSPVCVGTPLHLSVSNISGATYQWIGPNGFTSSQQNPLISNFSNITMSGVYKVFAYKNNNLISSDSTIVFVNNIIPTKPIASSNSPVCINNTLILSASNIPNAFYTWKGPNGYSSSIQNPIVLFSSNNLLNGDYIVYAIVNGCKSDSDTTTVVINNQYPQIPHPINQTVCSNTVLYLSCSVIPNAGYSWIGPNGFNSTQQNPLLSNSVTTLMNGTYYVASTFNGCISSFDSCIITISPLPASAGTINGIQNVYTGQQNVQYSIPAIANATSYLWTLPNGATGTSTTNTITVNYSSSAVSGNITVKGVNLCGNGLESSLYITVNPINPNCSAQFDLVADTTTPHHYFAVNNASGIPPLQYNWSWGDGSFSTTAYPTHTYSASGNYKICLTIIDSVGCTTIYCDSSYLQKDPNAIISVQVIPQGSSGINNLFSDKIKIYPNPAKENLTIELTESNISQRTTISFYNIQGQLCKQILSNQSKTEVDIKDLSTGLYVVKLNNEKESFISKFVKE